MDKLLALLLAFLSLGQHTLDAYIQETNPGGNLYLVNRTYRLSKDYVPPDLVKPDVLCLSQDLMLRKEAAEALKELFDAAKAEQGYVLCGVSGYRGYFTQAAIFKRKIGRTGSEGKAKLLVAPPGTSEHQLGLAIDIGRKNNSGLNKGFGSSPEGQWVAENAHRFGYIIRYQKDATSITGYAYEPWHLRYVGKEHAPYIYELNIPLDVYVEKLRETVFGELMAKGGETDHDQGN